QSGGIDQGIQWNTHGNQDWFFVRRPRVTIAFCEAICSAPFLLYSLASDILSPSTKTPTSKRSLLLDLNFRSNSYSNDLLCFWHHSSSLLLKFSSLCSNTPISRCSCKILATINSLVKS